MSVRAAIYARYSSENQRKESIEDQIASCRREAALKGLVVPDPHVFADYAKSGTCHDRPALLAMLEAARERRFEVLLVDDLSRFARDNTFMLMMMAELRYHGVSVIAVADRLDTTDEEAALVVEIRGIFNELQLSDLRKVAYSPRKASGAAQRATRSSAGRSASRRDTAGRRPVSLIAVADRLDTADEHAALVVQIRGIFNELQLSDLRKVACS